MASTKDYKKIYETFMDYNQNLHHQNQKKIRVGLKVNIFVPLIFLVLSFAISEAKLVFLLLWICSLFGIAFYLIYIEFRDYKMMNQLREMGVEDDVPREEPNLIGENMQQAETIVAEKLDQADQRILEERQRIEAEIAERTQRLKELVLPKKEKEGENHEEHH